MIFGDVYYNKTYFKSLVSVLIDRDSFSNFSREFKFYPNDRGGKYKICSVASSARLCFMYFQANPDITFEEELKTGLGGFPPTLDAYDVKKNVYYECKCHEFFKNYDVKEKKLKPTYRDLIKEHFGFKEIIEENERLEIKLTDLEINDPRTIYQLKFDLKQMLCHLLGIVKNHAQGEATLQYIFFTPSESLRDTNQEIEGVYEELKEDIEMIWNSTFVKNFREKVELPDPKFIPVDKIEDLIGEKL